MKKKNQKQKTIGWEDKIFDEEIKFIPTEKGVMMRPSYKVYCPKKKRLVSWSFEDDSGECNQCEYFQGRSYNGIYCGFRKKIRKEEK